MTDHPTFRHHESFELDVLRALAAGATHAADVAARTGASEDRARTTLDWAVGAGLATCLGQPGSATYALTPRGLELVGVAQGIDGAVSPTGHVDLEAASRLVMEQYQGARDVAARDALREQAGWPVDDSVRDRVTAALNDAYARGALSQEQLGDRIDRALSATTMGELRASADGVLELPPTLPTGVTVARRTGATQLSVNPALLQVRWTRVAGGAFLIVVGVVLLLVQPLVGVVLLVAGAAIGLWALRPLLATGTTRIDGR